MRTKTPSDGPEVAWNSDAPHRGRPYIRQFKPPVAFILSEA